MYSFAFRSYIRGQNIPLDEVEMAERERKRQIAIAHQQAIRQQLEEKEKRRKEERQKRIQEEMEEELRIERERELDRQRREIEIKRMQEKNERERKRKEALQEALEIAQKAANQKGEKQKLLKQNMNENIREMNKSPRKDEIGASSNDHNVSEKPEEKLNNENDMELNNAVKTQNANVLKDTNRVENEVNNNRSLTPRQQLLSFRDNSLAFVLQSPLDTLQGMPFAVLMPTLGNSLPQTLPIAVPITTVENTAVQVQQPDRTQNRLLTPTQYRNKHFCDSSTQTDCLDYNHNENNAGEKFIREKMSTLDINECKRFKERRREIAAERPKWGVNKPQMRYLKQSEKDPLYQRRKIKQKIRQIKVYNDKYSNYSARSSDDSQVDSPTHQRRRERTSRASWRKNEHLFARNVSVYQTEIIPLESDRDQIYYKHHTHRCCCQCFSDKVVHDDNVRTVEMLKVHQNRNELPQCSSFGSIDDSQAD